jgi:pyrimidine operon attenuation protein/uracil phosphoribosyltransferase
MTEPIKQVSPDWNMIMDADLIDRAMTRMCYEITEQGATNQLAIVGIRTGGEHLGRRVHAKLKELLKIEIPFGIIDITLYRDDLFHVDSQPMVKGTDLPFSLDKKRIILVDDVLYTGRTIRAALDALIDFGRPGKVELAVLVDRGHRELPIRPDFVGKNLPTNRDQFVRIRLKEMNYLDAVYLIDKK